jgi:hypothetical protein
MSPLAMLRPDYDRYEGVRPVKIYLLRLLFLLVFVFVGYDAWSTLLLHAEPWDPVRAAAFCMWGSYALLSVLGLLYPLKLLPLVLFEIVYKLVWLGLVAYPLRRVGALWNSPAAEMTVAFLWVVLPIVAMPWRYFLGTYVLNHPSSRVQGVSLATKVQTLPGAAVPQAARPERIL